MNKIAAIATVLAASGAAFAQIDGQSFAAEYGAPLWVQSIGTQFGNNTDPSVDFAGGSEIDNIHAGLSGGVLSLGLGGNLETNFNKINIALDFIAGGQQTLSGLPNLGALDGLTLDNGFEADVVLSYTAGNDPLETFIDGATAGGAGGFLGGGDQINGTSVLLDGAAVNFFMDNSNVGGVGNLGDPNDSDPALVDTGLEMSIDLAALGYTGGLVKITAWVNGSGNDFLANQVVGGLPDGTGNLGGPSGVDFSQIEGDQFVVIPTPGAAGLLAVAGLAAIRRRR